MDCPNDFFVGMDGSGRIGPLLPVMGLIEKEKALRLAAWIVALADPLDEAFPAVLAAVRSS